MRITEALDCQTVERCGGLKMYLKQTRKKYLTMKSRSKKGGQEQWQIFMN
jgi:hypothetical protein